MPKTCPKERAKARNDMASALSDGGRGARTGKLTAAYSIPSPMARMTCL